jgi:Flp pilus assembly pilin Flp
MRKLLQKLWADDAGALIATEWVFIVTILVIGLVVGLKSVQKAVVNELVDIANAVGALSQTYSYGGTSGCDGSHTTGSRFSDARSTYSVNTHTNDFDERTNACGD